MTHQCDSDRCDFDAAPESVEERLAVDQLGEVRVRAQPELVLGDHFEDFLPARNDRKGSL